MYNKEKQEKHQVVNHSV